MSLPAQQTSKTATDSKQQLSVGALKYTSSVAEVYQ